ncbi:hypothetical protein TNCT_734121 [Trichonephila clavata]|uniref:Uncharacterized protein n=1 Tax=Trichonephila clavata TaxID=2740835 RepID=A0A8X6GFM7_TRICU|nr:hypothetical protein TNCT_734121 [Trichonephila clavata]
MEGYNKWYLEYQAFGVPTDDPRKNSLKVFFLSTIATIAIHFGSENFSVPDINVISSLLTEMDATNRYPSANQIQEDSNDLFRITINMQEMFILLLEAVLQTSRALETTYDLHIA